MNVLSISARGNRINLQAVTYLGDGVYFGRDMYGAWAIVTERGSDCGPDYDVVWVDKEMLASALAHAQGTGKT